jgi:hypothetical protein
MVRGFIIGALVRMLKGKSQRDKIANKQIGFTPLTEVAVNSPEFDSIQSGMQLISTIHPQVIG